MSAYVCASDATGVAMLTDGAAYDTRGVIVKLGRKVTIGKSAPIAVTTRGRALIGERHQRRLCDTADLIGVDQAVEIFADFVEALAEMEDPGERGHVQWHIAAWSETWGPVQYLAHNIPGGFSDGTAPFKLHSPEGIYYTSAPLVFGDLASIGVRPRTPGESIGAFFEAIGAAMMEAMRRRPLPLLAHQESDGAPQYLIGGQCDLAVVTPEGATVKTLKTWPDRIGDKINPFADAGNVAILSRQQRRAMERERMKRAG